MRTSAATPMKAPLKTFSGLKRLFGLAALCLLACPTASRAQAFHIQMDMSPLYGQGTFYIEEQLTDGSGAGDGDSQVVINHVTFTGGTFGSVLLPILGNATGDLSSGLTLIDGPVNFGSVADWAVKFTVDSPDSNLSFDVNLGTASVNTPIPDKFSMLILDSGFNPLPTDGPTSAEFLSADFTSMTPGISAFGTTSDSPVALSSPQIAAVPEPGGVIISVISLLLLMTMTRRRHYSA